MTTTEKYFKARATSFRKIIFGGYEEYSEWVEGVNAYLVDGEWVRNDRYDLTQSYPDFKKFVLEKMEREGFRMNIVHQNQTSRGLVPICQWLGIHPDPIEEIKDNEILEAAVIAATEYWRQKK